MSDDEPDVMQQVWCCLTCSQTFRWGKVRYREGGLHCPYCGGRDMDRASDVFRRALAGAKAQVAAMKAKMQ